MSGIISMELSHRIWSAHREIAVATKLRDELAEALRKGEDPTPLDGFGRRRNLSLGVPCGTDSSQRLYDVDPKLAVHVIDAHVASKQKDLAEACIAARIELGDVAAGKEVTP